MKKSLKTVFLGVGAASLIAVMASANPYGYETTSYNESFSGDRSNDTVKETRDVAAFTKIHIKGAIKLLVNGGEDQSLDVEVDEDFVDHLITKVIDGTLVIDMTKKGKKKHWNGPKVEVKISMQTLESIELDGAMDAAFTNLNGSDLNVDINGAGNLEIEGTCGTLTVHLSGAGNVEAEDFKCKNADLKLSGVGNIEAYATESANVRLAGLGNIDVYGSPKNVHKKKGGFGSIDIH